MNKKFLIPTLLSGLLLSALSFRTSLNVSYANGVINFDVDDIQALSHANGVTVNFVNSDIASYWDNDATDISKLKTLYEMNSEIESFASNSYDYEYVRNLYAKWDDFKPTNNTLSWKSNVSAKTFDIVVYLNPELTEDL